MQQFDQAPVPDDIQAQVGTLSNLTTTDKSNLVGAVNEVKSTLSDLFPFAKGTALDCNALTSEGAWRTNANTLNMPNNKTGFCEVYLRASESQIFQKYSTVDGYVYWRYTTNGSFANISWKEELNDQIANIVKSTSASLSPNSAGVASVSLANTTVIIGASDGTHVFIPFYFNGGWKVLIRNYSDFSAVTSGTYSVTVYGI